MSTDPGTQGAALPGWLAADPMCGDSGWEGRLISLGFLSFLNVTSELVFVDLSCVQVKSSQLVGATGLEPVTSCV